MLEVTETLVRHASDMIRWVDGAARWDNPNPAPVTARLEVQIVTAPRDLRLFHKSGQTVLWRSVPTALGAAYPGQASSAEVERPSESNYTVAGSVRDPERHFNPRRFEIVAGGAAKHSVTLFRAPLGTRIPKAGALLGNVRFSDVAPASWALLELRVVPAGAGVDKALFFKAQADRHGDFIMPLTWLPANPEEVTNEDSPPRLSIQAGPALIDAEMADFSSLAAVQIADLDSGALLEAVEPELSPGSVTRLASQGETYLRVATS